MRKKENPITAVSLNGKALAVGISEGPKEDLATVLDGNTGGFSSSIPYSLQISHFRRKSDNIPAPKKVKWDDFIARIKNPKIRRTKDGPLFSPTIYKPQTARANKNVTHITALVLDYDHNASFADDLNPWLDYTFAAYTTHSHLRTTEKNPDAEERFRIVVLLKSPIPADKFPLLWQWAYKQSGRKIDRQAKDVARMHYLPAVANEFSEYEPYVNEGELLDWEEKLREMEEEDGNSNSLKNEQHTPITPVASKCSSAPSSTNDLEAAKNWFLERKLQRGLKVGSDGKLNFACTCKAGNHKGKSKSSGFINIQGTNGINITCNAQERIGVEDIKSILETENIHLESSSYKIEEKHRRERFSLVKLNEVGREDVSFLFYPYIPIGKVTLLAGEPGVGKSWIALALASLASKGERLFEESRQEPVNVLICSAEDGIRDTMKPRLECFSRDESRIIAVEDRFTLNTSGLIKLEEAIKDADAKLVIIDPIVAFVGANRDINKSNEVRQVLDALSAIAERNSCAFLVIAHFNKDSKNTKANNRIMGSVDFVAGVRSVLAVAPDPNNAENRVIVHTKYNLTPNGDSLLYSLIPGSGFKWIGKSKVTADELLVEKDSEIDTVIKATLQDRDGKILTTDLLEILGKEGYSVDQVKRRLKPLGIESVREHDRWYKVSGTRPKNLLGEL